MEVGSLKEHPRETTKEERTTVIKMNDENEFEIEKLTEKEIKETHLFQSSVKKQEEEDFLEVKPEAPKREKIQTDIELEIEDSQIGASHKKVKKSTYGSKLKHKVDQYNVPEKDVQTTIDIKYIFQYLHPYTL